MKASVIIPVWNGGNVIGDCLKSLFTIPDKGLSEVICVDNHSQDDSVRIIIEEFPQVKLLTQPINFGFAGAVNRGIQAASSDIFILLNQDCIVRPNWLTAILECFNQYPDTGIVGSVILTAEGAIDHAGARISRPDGRGVHLNKINNPESLIEYVTGASMAIRKEAWQKIGKLDEEYYPAYYEDADYCYRARREGFQIRVAPESTLVHIRSGQYWLKDPIEFAKIQYKGMYRFVSKHFTIEEIDQFLNNQNREINEESYLSEIVGRYLSAKYILRNIRELLFFRQQHKDDRMEDLALHLRIGFNNLARISINKANDLAVKWVSDSNNYEETDDEYFSLLDSLREQKQIIQKEIDYYLSPVPINLSWKTFLKLYTRIRSVLSGKLIHLLVSLYDIDNKIYNTHTQKMEFEIYKMNELQKLLKMITEYDAE